MTVLVCGSRGWEDYTTILHALRDFGATNVIHGGARGADRLAHIAAEALELSVQSVEAEWDRYGRAAGPRRNVKMIAMKPDLVLAFGAGRGTDHTVRLADRNHIPVKRFYGDDQPVRLPDCSLKQPE